MMKQGGNAHAREAFGELVLNMKDLHAKYISKASLSYKEKLQRKAKEAALMPSIENLSIHPTTAGAAVPEDNNLINFDQPEQPQKQQSLIDFDDNNVTATTKKKKNDLPLIDDSNEDDDDFDIFKPVVKKESPVTKTSSIFDELASPSSSYVPATNTNHSIFDDFQSAPTTTTTTSAQNNTTGLLLDDFISSPPINNTNEKNQAVDDFFDQFEKPSSTTPTTTTTTKRTFKAPNKQRANTKLGARKVQSNVFQQQTELALREEKMREQGHDEESIGRSSRNHLLINSNTPIPKLQVPTTSGKLTYQYEPTKEEQEKHHVDKDRLGIMSLPSSLKKKQVVEKEEEEGEDTFAREKFGNAKSISSDQYFGRNTYVPADTARLAQFSNSSSISSDQYFGRKSKSNSGSSSTPMSKKIIRAASKGANKLSNMLAELEVKSLVEREKEINYANTCFFNL